MDTVFCNSMSAYHIWQRVSIQFTFRQGWKPKQYPAEITAVHENNKYDIIYAKGAWTEENIPASRILSSYPHVSADEVASLPAGTKIRLLWKMDRVYYIATILEHYLESGLTKIEYEHLTDENELSDVERYEVLDLKTHVFQKYKWEDDRLNKKERKLKQKKEQTYVRVRACRICVNCQKPDCGVCNRESCFISRRTSSITRLL